MRRFMLPSVSPAKAGAQEPRWGRCHGADLSAVGFLPARCSGSLEKTARSVPRRLWWFDVLLAATQCSVVPGSRRSPGKRGEGRKAEGPGAAVVPLPQERTSAQWIFRRHDAQALLKNSTLPAAESLAARCPFGRHPVLGGPWLPAFAGKTRG